MENQLKLIQLNTKIFSSASVDEDFSFFSEPFKNLHDLQEFCKMFESNKAFRYTLVWTSNIAYLLILLICSNFSLSIAVNFVLLRSEISANCSNSIIPN